MGIYVETLIRGSMDDLWRLTRTPDLHVRWDLRFTDIEHLSRVDEGEPQRFLYATRMGFGIAIRGEGETAGSRDASSGERVSSLKFWSDDGMSLIREGSGYWRYVPTADGVRFLTSYDYRVRFGAAGRAVDAAAFRPLLGWATAWSFDRLRLWIEKGIDPAVSMQRTLIHVVARGALALTWIYHGLVPKLLRLDADELILLERCGVPAASAPTVLRVIGWSEVALGLAMLFVPRRAQLWLTIALMVGATISVSVTSPRYLSAAFNPVSLNLLMSAVAVIGILSSRDLPSAQRCLRAPHEARA